MRFVRLLVPLAACLTLVAGGCEPRDRNEWDVDPPVAFDTVAVLIETSEGQVRIRAEIAETSAQRAHGLMERPSLPPEQGMLFMYVEPQDEESGFWMYRTRIPLDIAFLDEDGTILTILAMEPCPDVDPRGCRTYPPGVPYHSALEVNRGWFAQRGVGVGDRVVLQRFDDSALR